MRYLLGLLALFFLAPLAGYSQGTCPSGAPVSGNHCYFISAQSGADTNNGTTESTPWAHAPGMTGCARNCASHSYGSGEVYIFKGCDTWDFSTIHQWTPGANNVYFGGY